jgi:hypothetical protein
VNTSRIRSALVNGALPALLAASTVLGGAATTVHAEDDLTIEGFVDDAPLAGSDSNDPIVVEPDSSATLSVDVTNLGGEPVDLSRVRLEGRALGVVFVAYDTSVDAVAAPGTATRLEIPLTFYDLGDQATGLLPATLIVYGEDGDAVAMQRFTLDVRGDLTSIVGVFTLTVIALTVFGSVLLAKQIAARRLPANRWHRALQFAPIGLGIGLIATIALAVLRIAAPHGTVWFPLLVVPTAIAFVLGYLAPGPLSDDEDEDATEAGVPGLDDPMVEAAAPSAASHDDPRATRPARHPRPLIGSRT